MIENIVYHFINLDRGSMIKKSAHAINGTKLSNIWPPIIRSIVSGSEAEVACARRPRVKKTLHPWHQWHRNIGIEPIVHSLHEHDTFHTFASLARALPTPPSSPHFKWQKIFTPFALFLRRKINQTNLLISFENHYQNSICINKNSRLKFIAKAGYK